MGYDLAREKLGFAKEWLEAYKDEVGQWDLGVKVNDQVYFPLSDFWGMEKNRKADCTEKIEMILQMLSREKVSTP